MPEELFSDELSEISELYLVDEPKLELSSDSPNLFILVGPQGAGKSTYAKKLADKYGDTIIINQDTLKTKKRVQTAFLGALSRKCNIIIDNTNRDIETRNFYIENAIVSGYSVHIIFWNIPKELSMQMCKYRESIDGKSISPIAIHTYYKRLEAPTPSPSDQYKLIIVDGIIRKSH